MTSRSSFVSFPHCSWTLPLNCFQFPSTLFQSIFLSLLKDDNAQNVASSMLVPCGAWLPCDVASPAFKICLCSSCRLALAASARPRANGYQTEPESLARRYRERGDIM